MAKLLQGEIWELFYEYVILAKNIYSPYFKIKSFKPMPNTQWQFEVSFTDLSGKQIPYTQFLVDRDSQIRITLFSLSKMESTTFQCSGVISVEGVPCLMQISSLPFLLKHEQLVSNHAFIFQKKSCSIGEDNSNIHIQCKFFSWETHEPAPSSSKSKTKNASNASPIANKVLNSYKQMYCECIMSDVTFTNSKHVLKAHKCVLSARSPIFRKMFNVEENSNTIPIEDCDLMTFNKFLLFLYTGEMEAEQQSDILSLYVIASKYAATDLLEACAKKLNSILTPDNVIAVLVCGHLHDDKRILQLAKSFIKTNFVEVACQRAWAELVIVYPDLALDISKK